MATIRKRGELQWQAIVKRKGVGSTSKTFFTKKDAEDWAKITEAEMIRGHYIKRNDAEKTTLSELINRYRETILPTKRGKHFGPALNALEASLGKLALSAISSKKVTDFRDKRLKVGLSGSTVKKEINLLSKLFDLSEKEWGIALPANPCANVSRPKESRHRSRRLEAGEEARLLEAIAKTKEATQLRALFVFALETGARLGELLSLRWSEVDFTKRVVTLHGIEIDGKRQLKNSDTHRFVPLSPDAVAALQELRRPIDDGRVFHVWARSDSFTKQWQRVCAAAGVIDFRFHDLRHEFASRMAPRVPMHVLMKLLGHKSPAMVARYYNETKDDVSTMAQDLYWKAALLPSPEISQETPSF